MRVAIAMLLASISPSFASEPFSASEVAEYQAPMAFSRQQDGSILAMGTIEHNTVDIFKAFADREKVKAGEVLRLASPGGVPAIPLAEAISQRGLTTFIGDPYRPNYPVLCASACTTAFIGGVQRLVSPGAIFQVHAPEPHLPDGSLNEPGKVVFSVENLRTYANSLGDDIRFTRARGIDPEYNSVSYKTPHTDATTLDMGTLIKWGIVTSPVLSQDKQSELLQSDPLRRELCRRPDAVVKHSLRTAKHHSH